MESTLFKNTSRGRTSGILKGPITMVYAVGGIAIILLDKYLMPRIKTNKINKTNNIIYYLFSSTRINRVYMWISMQYTIWY